MTHLQAFCCGGAGRHTTANPSGLRHASCLADRACAAGAWGARPPVLNQQPPRRPWQALPARGRLVPGHCVIVPADHVASTRQVDEQVSLPPCIPGLTLPCLRLDKD